jgi:methylthioribulose-1-phosphate dehydratase
MDPMTNSYYQECCSALITLTAELAQRGLTPATSSNFSMRLNAQQCIITQSGRDKGHLTADDFMLVNQHGLALDPALKPSAETLLHTQIYAQRPEAHAVIHTHSLAQTLLSMHYAEQSYIEFKGYELLKAFTGTATHEYTMSVPIFPNSQNMQKLSAWIAPHFERSDFWGYLIAGHGLYTWGRDMPEAKRHFDAFEFLLNAELTKLSFAL